jgi:hypothetical protein
MAIPETQLETWSHQGSVTQSKETYNGIKNTLEGGRTPYSAKSYEVFLQGSYGNDTNIFAESDVDVVIRLDDSWHHDLSALSDLEKTAFHKAYPNATYTYFDFKKDVIKVLTDKYGADVKEGEKAIAIIANGGRRKSDVIVALQFRRYYKFNGVFDESYTEGICFYDKSGTLIVNYPKQHSSNCTAKHKASSQWFKPMARVLKNMRNKMIDQKIIEAGSAPSYYLEGLLYNVPPDRFSTNYQTCFCDVINWLNKADSATREKWVCANEQYYLLREGFPVTWRAAKCEAFISGAIKLWNEW